MLRPHTYTNPFDLTNTVWFFPASICTTSVKPGICVGIYLFCVSFSAIPNCAYSLLPQAYTVIFDFKNNACDSPCAIDFTSVNPGICVGTYLVVVSFSPIPKLPYALLPQAYTVPSVFKNNEKPIPADICFTSANPGICVGTYFAARSVDPIPILPFPLLPQAYTVPSVFKNNE